MACSLLSAAEVPDIPGDVVRQGQLGYLQDFIDAYPCTPLQEGLLALVPKEPASDMARHVYRLADGVDVS